VTPPFLSCTRIETPIFLFGPLRIIGVILLRLYFIGSDPLAEDIQWHGNTTVALAKVTDNRKNMTGNFNYLKMSIIAEHKESELLIRMHR
jgi:hypothetical protein